MDLRSWACIHINLLQGFLVGSLKYCSKVVIVDRAFTVFWHCRVHIIAKEQGDMFADVAVLGL